MNNFGRSMNEIKFRLVLFKPSTHLFQWSEIGLCLLLRRSVEGKFCQTYIRKPCASEIFVKLSKTVRANDSQTKNATRQ